MGGTEKRQLLDSTKASMLADMGVQVWYERPTAAQPELEPAPPPAPEPLPVAQLDSPPPVQAPRVQGDVEIIEFSYLKNAQALVACPLGIDPTAMQLLRDVLAYSGWLNRAGTDKISQRPGHGDFRWPQLVDSSGTPLRALTAFYDKHFADAAAVLLLTAEVAPMLTPWLTQLAETLPIKIVELPALPDSISDASAKKQIWQILQQSL